MLKVPPTLLGAALLFWGWRTDLFLFAAVGAVILESAHTFKARWEFTEKEFNRLWDVCSLIFVGVAVFLRFSEDLTNAAYRFFQWFPLIFFPMVLGQVYSSRETIPLKAFSWFLRRKGAEGGDRPVAFGWVYYAVCIVSAGATNVRDVWFYLAVAALAGAGLWAIRPKRLSLPGWAAVFGLAVIAGFLAQGQMQAVQNYLEGKVSDLLVHFGRREFDPRETRTSIGSIGSLKQSSRIVLKVKPEIGEVPQRLRQGTYFRYHSGVWGGTRRGFEELPVEQDLTSWTLVTTTNYSGSVRIIERMARKRSMLSLPLGTARLMELASSGVETNSLGLVRGLDNPKLGSYVAQFGSKAFLDRPEAPWDKEIPKEELEVIREVAAGLDVEGKTPEEIIERIGRFFTENFRYTTYQSARILGMHSGTPLGVFLRNTRAGHCEYFGSATVLLLRYFGIPARYATGYAVQESSREGDEYIVRDRHAHAWAMAFVKGRWIEVDTTPAGWDAAEQSEMPAWQPLKDWWESLTFGFLEWRWLGESGMFRQAAPWLIGGLGVFLAWRVFGRRMKTAVAGGRKPEIWPGADSEFYELERKLERAGLARDAAETPAQWAGRVQVDSPGMAAVLGSIVSLHYKYRFDPKGIEPSEREELRQLVRSCLGRA